MQKTQVKPRRRSIQKENRFPQRSPPIFSLIGPLRYSWTGFFEWSIDARGERHQRIELERIRSMVFPKQPVALLQLNLFDSPLPISGFRLHSTSLFASGNVDIENPFQPEAMKSHTPLLPFTDEVNSSEDELATGTGKDKSHVLQNSRTWIDRAESRFAPKPAVQKLLDFDHKSMGGRSAQPPSGYGHTTEAGPARVERTSNIQPSSRTGHSGTPNTHGEQGNRV